MAKGLDTIYRKLFETHDLWWERYEDSGWHENFARGIDELMEIIEHMMKHGLDFEEDKKYTA